MKMNKEEMAAYNALVGKPPQTPPPKEIVEAWPWLQSPGIEAPMLLPSVAESLSLELEEERKEA